MEPDVKQTAWLALIRSEQAWQKAHEQMRMRSTPLNLPGAGELRNLVQAQLRKPMEIPAASGEGCHSELPAHPLDRVVGLDVLFAASMASAHEARPAYLEIQENFAGDNLLCYGGTPLIMSGMAPSGDAEPSRTICEICENSRV